MIRAVNEVEKSVRDLGCARIPAVGVAVEVVEEGADEVFHAVAGGVVEGRVVRVVLPVTELV